MTEANWKVGDKISDIEGTRLDYVIAIEEDRMLVASWFPSFTTLNYIYVDFERLKNLGLKPFPAKPQEVRNLLALLVPIEIQIKKETGHDLSEFTKFVASLEVDFSDHGTASINDPRITNPT